MYDRPETRPRMCGGASRISNVDADTVYMIDPMPLTARNPSSDG